MPTLIPNSQYRLPLPIWTICVNVTGFDNIAPPPPILFENEFTLIAFKVKISDLWISNENLHFKFVGRWHYLICSTIVISVTSFTIFLNILLWK